MSGWFGYRFRAPGIDFAARWSDLEPPFYAEGPNGGFSDTEDIWSLFLSARTRLARRSTASRRRERRYDDDVWLPKLGRSVSSAHSAFAETRLTPA